MVSIIIPAYNCAEVIDKTIGSILEQTYKDFEIIIVNDGSKDATAEKLDRWVKEGLQNIKYYTIPNSGAYAARLFGVGKANGEWIAFVDADDTVPRDSLELLMAENDADIVVGTLNLNNKSIFKHGVYGLLKPQDYIRAILTHRTSIGSYGKLYRRSIFDLTSFNLEIRINQNEDMLMLIMLARNAKRIKILPDKVVYNYIYSPHGMSRKTKPLTEWFTLFSIMGNILGKLPYKEEIKSEFLHYRIKTIYEQGVLKLNNFQLVENELHEFSEEIKFMPLDDDENKMIKAIYSPLRRFLYGFIWTSKERVKYIVKNLLRYG